MMRLYEIGENYENLMAKVESSHIQQDRTNTRRA